MDGAPFEPGAEVTPFSRLGTIETWAHYAAVNYEFAAHHMDDAQARHEGFPGAFAMAPLLSSYMQTMLREWIGDSGRVASLAIQVRRPFLRGRRLTATGVVRAVRVEASEWIVEVDLWADDDEGTRLIQGTGAVALPRS